MQFAYDFCRFKKANEESKEVLSNLVTLSKKLELDSQEGNFIELFSLQHEFTNKDLMELETQSKDEERQEEDVTEELKRFMMQVMQGFSLFEETLLVFDAQDWM